MWSIVLKLCVGVDIMEDKYLWLEELDNPETLEFVERHNRRFREYVGSLPDKFFPRIMRYYGVMHVYTFKPTEKGIYILTREPDGFKVKLLDWGGEVREIVSSKDFGDEIVIAGIYPHRDSGLLGVFYTEAGSDVGRLVILDESSKKVIDSIEGSVWNLIWLDGDRYLYTRFYRSGSTPDGVDAPTSRVFLRELGGKEEMVFGEGVETNYVIGVGEVPEEDWVFAVVSYGWVKSKVYGGPKDRPDVWKLIYDGGDYRVSPISYRDGKSYLITYDGRGLGRVISVDEYGVEEVVSEFHTPLRGGELVGDRLYLNYLVDASSRIKVYNLEGGLIDEIVFKEPIDVVSIEGYRDKVFLFLQSFSRPAYLAYLDDGEAKPLYGYDPGVELDVSEGWVESEDGVKIHYFKVRRRGVEDNNVAIVYGYGGFGIPLTPIYTGYVIPFLEDGGTFIMANLRGGSEYGEEWHRMGMRRNKMNVFKDFRAVASYMKGLGYRVVCWGGSNGGLLVAATFALYPGVMDIAIIGYPVLDMLRFHKLFIGRLWTTEYGDPEDPEDREYLLRYSPYHIIEPGKEYPVTLVYTGLHDDRVHPGHAFKFVARLEELGYNPYLRVETVSGHLGATPETKAREYADIYAFIYKSLGLVEG